MGDARNLWRPGSRSAIPLVARWEAVAYQPVRRRTCLRMNQRGDGSPVVDWKIGLLRMPSWRKAKDGERIVWVLRGNRADGAASARRVELTMLGEGTTPTMSPDGKVVYTGNVPAIALLVMDLDGGNTTRMMPVRPARWGRRSPMTSPTRRMISLPICESPWNCS